MKGTISSPTEYSFLHSEKDCASIVVEEILRLMKNLHRLFVAQEGNSNVKPILWAAFALQKDAEEFIFQTQRFNTTWTFTRKYFDYVQVYPAKQSINTYLKEQELAKA